MNEQDGRWVTMNGTHVFIKNGQSPMDAFIKQKGKSIEKDYKGHLENYDDKDEETYYQLDDGTKVKYIDKKEYKKMIDDFYDSLTEDEKVAIDQWAAGGVGNNPMFIYDKDYAKIFEDCFNKKGIILQEDTLLFRRANDNYVDLQGGINKNRYLSTSAYDTIPKTMPSGTKFGEKELYIIAPAGTKIMPIEKVAVEMTEEQVDKKAYTRQHEIVINKNSGYELVEDLSTYRNPDYGDKKSSHEEKYVVKLTNKKYKKREYDRVYQNRDFLNNYIIKKGKKEIKIEERIYGLGEVKRSEIIYAVQDLSVLDKPYEFHSYDDAVKAINKYL